MNIYMKASLLLTLRYAGVRKQKAESTPPPPPPSESEIFPLPAQMLMLMYSPPASLTYQYFSHISKHIFTFYFSYMYSSHPSYYSTFFLSLSFLYYFFSFFVFCFFPFAGNKVFVSYLFLRYYNILDKNEPQAFHFTTFFYMHNCLSQHIFYFIEITCLSALKRFFFSFSWDIRVHILFHQYVEGGKITEILSFNRSRAWSWWWCPHSSNRTSRQLLQL